MTAERWLPVVGFPNYDVSSEGRIRRALDAPKRAATDRGRIRRPWISSSTGYAMLTLYRPGRRPAWRTVHSLVAETFIGPPPPGMEVLHRDGNRANAALSNLFYDTRAANHRQAYRDGREVRGAAAAGPGTARPNARLDDDSVRAIRARYRRGDAPALAAEYGVSRALILQVIHRRAWAHVDSEPISVMTEGDR